MATKAKADAAPQNAELGAALEKIAGVLADGIAALQQVMDRLEPAAKTMSRRKSRGRAVAPIDDTPRTAAGPMRKVGREWVPADADPDDIVGLATEYPEANIKPQRRLAAQRLAQANGRGAHVAVGEQSGMAGAFGPKATGTAKERLRAGLAGG